MRSECTLCDGPIIRPEVVLSDKQWLLCPGCRFELQVKVDRAVRAVEREMMMSGLPRARRRRPRPRLAVALAVLVVVTCLVALWEACR